MRATWYSDGFREWFERSPPGVMGDEGVIVELATPELMFRYAARLFARSQTYAVLVD